MQKPYTTLIQGWIVWDVGYGIEMCVQEGFIGKNTLGHLLGSEGNRRAEEEVEHPCSSSESLI